MNRLEHLFVILGEECAEVQQAVSKALRFGLDDGYPGTGRTNHEDIRVELNQLFALVEMLEDEGMAFAHDEKVKTDKKVKVEHYIEYAKQRGIVT